LPRAGFFYIIKHQKHNKVLPMRNTKPLKTISLSLTDTIFEIGRGFVGGSTLKMGQHVEYYNREYRVNAINGYEQGSYEYDVEFIKNVA
jgi:hypothetical protein